MTAAVGVRAFVPEDMGAVIDMLQDVSAYRPAAQIVPALADAFATQANCYACVAVSDGRVVAFGSVFVLNRVRGGRTGIIEDVVVVSDVRGKGVGQLIVEALVAAARARGCFKVSLEAAASAQSFYAASGFEAGGLTMGILL
uniref:GNAT family N-acetyltransferase n=1 Tax=Orrella sp. TaxID=1921583 RepID=UPI0040478904